MDLGFINWWFDKHYIFSTLLTPALTLAWCFYKGLVLRGILAGILTLVFIGRTCGGKCWDKSKCGTEGKVEGCGSTGSPP